MIILNDKKSNTFNEKCKINFNIKKKLAKIEEEIIKYEKQINVGYIKCPCCDNDNLISYGSYERNVVVSSNSYKIKIKRVKCNRCGKTHAIIPNFLKPYFQYESSFIDFVMVLLIARNKRNKEIEKKLKITRQLIRKWKKRFEMHKTRLLTYKNLEIKKLIYEVFNREFLKEYYEKNKVVYFSKITNISFS